MANRMRLERPNLAPSPLARDPFETMGRLMGWDPFSALNQWPGSSWPLAAQGSFAPAFEVRETTDAYMIEADVPGVQEKDVDIELSGNRLTVSGTRGHEERRDEGSYHTYERSYGSFVRSFTLPEDTDLDGIDAQLANGVLRVRVPKHGDVSPRKIKIGKPVERLVEKVKGMFGVGHEKHESRQDPRA
jgi:HSP20 family protein